MNKWILITGAHGFLGRNCSLFFKKNGYRVIGIGHGKWQDSNFTQYGIDIWKERDVNFKNLSEIKQKFNLIIHCAGGGSIEFSMKNPAQDFQKTVITTLSVLEYMRLFQKEAKLILPSSVAVYGDSKGKKIKEDDSLQPISCYGYHKKIAETLCESYSQKFGLKIIIIRFFSLYGRGLKKQLLWDACMKFKKNKKTAEFFGSGLETRDWLHIDDAVNLIYKSTKTDSKFVIYNGASGKSYCIKYMIRLLTKEFDYHGNIVFSKNKTIGKPKYCLADVSKVRLLNWKPYINLDIGIKNYVNWFRQVKHD